MSSTLVTGGTGFLGSIIKEYLRSNGLSTSIMSRSSSEKGQIVCDLAKEVPDFSDCKFDKIVHCAGKAHMVPKTQSEADEFFAVNETGTSNLLKGLDANPLELNQFVHISTVAVYGKSAGEQIAEEAITQPLDPYGQSKLAAENLVREWCNKNKIPCLIMRLPLIVDKDAPGNMRSLINGIKRKRYVSIGDGGARKSAVYAHDIAGFVHGSNGLSGTYNFTDGHDPSFRELETIISEHYKVSVIRIPVILGRLIALVGQVANSILKKSVVPLDKGVFNKITSDLTFSNRKAIAEIGWNPTRVVDILKDVL